ncbi:MAG: hypothetical protein ABI333_22385 [bacterium]
MSLKIYRFALLGAALLLITACLGPLDTLGVVAKDSTLEELFKDPEIEDDVIEDKHQVCDPGLMTTVSYGSCDLSVNMSCSVTKLDVVEFDESQQTLADQLFPGRGAALEAISVTGGDTIPSMEVVNGTLKPFNDGLYAAIEVGVQDGVPAVYESKRQFLLDLATALHTADASATAAQRVHLQSALVFVLGALISGGTDVSGLGIDAAVLGAAQDAADDFTGELLNYTPMSFYTWNETLREVFIQDRFLQNRGSLGNTSVEEIGRFAAMAAVMEDASSLRIRYEGYVALYAGLTNPYVSYTAASLFDYVNGVASLEDVAAIRSDFLAENQAPFVCQGVWFALVPASRAKDSEFFNDTFCTSDPPADVNLIDVLINAIRGHLLDLEPDGTSGWYDYQLYALETLLVPEELPESDNLLLTKAYKEKLIETFKSLITQTRETHAKQITVFGGVGSAVEPTPVDVYPKFPVEPFPSFYLRTARAYRFLETMLHAVLGTGFLNATHRLNEDGVESTLTLAEELQDITRLVYGIYIVSARAVGLDPAEYLLTEETEDYPITDCVDRANLWLADWKTNVDVLKDPRVITPVGVLQTGEILYWAVLGVKVYRIHAEFVEGYVPTFASGDHMCEVRDVLDHHYLLLVEEMREVRIRGTVPPLTRDQFRQICDQHSTADDIAAALEAL